MCMIDDCDDRVNVLSDRHPLARKQHTCGECHRKIEPGERYQFEAGIIDGDFESYKTCTHCQVAREWLAVNCGGWLYQGVEEDFREHAQEYQRMDLWRVAAGMRRMWSTRKGMRMKVPQLPRPLEENDAGALLR